MGLQGLGFRVTLGFSRCILGFKALGLSGSRVSGMVSFVALRTMAKVSAFLRLWVWALSVAQGSVFGALQLGSSHR